MKKNGFIMSNFKGYKSRYIFALATTLIYSLITLLPTVVIGKIFDDVLSNQYGLSADARTSLLWRYAIIYVVVVFLQSSLYLLVRQICHRAAQHVAVGIRSRLYEKLQTLDFSFYTHNPSGEIISQLTTDVNVIYDFISTHLYVFVRDCAMLVFTFVILLMTSGIVTALLFSFIPFIVVFTVILHKNTRFLHRRLRDKFSEMNTYVNENLGAYRVVKAFAREKYEVGRLTKESEGYRDMAIDNTKIRLNYAMPIHITAELMRIIALCACGIIILLVPDSGLKIGGLYMATTYVYTVVARVRELSTIISQFQHFNVSVGKVTSLYETEPDIDNVEHIESKDGKIHKIEFRDVTLILDGHMILDHVSFTVREGQTVAIMGPTGAGKTILISMLLRLYDPSCGQILINNVDIKRMDLNRLRKMIALSTQDVFLFSDTIDGNIAYSNPDLPIEEVKHFAECAQAADFIEKLSEGYDTIIGERGVGLSGGQRQRIALARAVAKKSSLIILDDTTSAVDMETESLILHELAKIKNKIKIIVAQRITSVVDADKILVIENGKITEEGTHAELVQNGGYYTSIYNISQQGSTEVEK